jgi:formamidopyrimidine-DNA glycosylase
MPELPEVQTVVNQLNLKVKGKTIASFWSDWPKKVFTPLAAFKRRIKGATIVEAERIGKHIVIKLDNEEAIVIHLKMTGHLLYKTPGNRQSPAFTEDPKNGFIHHIFTFTDGSALEFSDMRKFAWIRLVPEVQIEELESIQMLGIDALSPKLNQKRFDAIVKKRAQRTIGEVLLEQNHIAGIGNIYRSEALFLAGVRPLRKAGSLTAEERKKVLSSIKTVLRQAVKLRGTSDGDFRDLTGMAGGFQRTLFVYRRHGKPCKKCGTIIERKKIGARSIFYCPSCQQ